MKYTARMTRKGQVVIPHSVREKLAWGPGTRLAVEIVSSDAVHLTPLKAEDPIDTLYGCLKDFPGDPLAELAAEHQAEIEAADRR